MAIRAIKAAASDWFRPASQTDSDDPAEFKVRGLSGYEQAMIAPELQFSSRGDLTFSANGLLMLFRYGLEDWRVVLDADGEPIEFEGLSPRQIQDMLHYNHQVEIGTEIFNRSFINLDDKKKS